MLKSSFPYALLILLMTIYSRVDSVLIERLLPNGHIAAGVYAQAFRLLDAANMFPFLFASLLLPIFSKMIKNNNKLSSFVGFSSILLLVPVVSFAIPTFVFRNHIMELLYVEHTAQSSQILGILMGSFVFIAVNYIFGTLLTAQGDLLKLNYISAVAVVISIFAQFILIGKFGIVGAAWGNLITNAFVAIFTVALAFQRYKFTIDKLYLYRSLLFLVTSIVVTLLLSNATVNPFVSLVIAFLSIILLSFVYRLVRVKELVSFFKKESPFE
jgi:O-antigen/teichoic acid export membrane protein